ncbi:hypothetical protein N7510_001344 [Penicillium lagena]|uniref:uncharacterized protein n=1 Tax=Penicillium lagena TaxID=94218 RepID=UPI0025412D8C|nr:uncharacterized protein N7510_001344 [Penicillium lagena]KAJ5625035.1 hypothetical protein N7510_001344 [Penicillium lagena]
MNHGSSHIPRLRHPQYTDNPIGDGLYDLRGPDPARMRQTGSHPNEEAPSRPATSGRGMPTELDHENRGIVGPMQQNVENANQRQLVWPPPPGHAVYAARAMYPGRQEDPLYRHYQVALPRRRNDHPPPPYSSEEMPPPANINAESSAAVGTASQMSSTNATWPGQDNSASPRLPQSEAPLSVEEELARVRRIRELRVDIENTERQLAVGSLPPMDRIIQMRNELFQIQDARYRNYFAARDGEVESLITRICNLYQRVDQLHVVQTRFPSWPFDNPSAIPIRRAYLVTSPNGFQGILTPPVATGTVQAPLFAPHTSTQTGPAPAPGPQAGIVGNAVRHAVLDQQRRPNPAEPRRGLARHLRRIWLFVRLYFFCYMISDPGTWTRIIFVGCAFLFALFSDTEIPQRLHGMMIAPIQHHLEGLVHLGEPGEQNGQTQAQAGAAQPATRDHEQDNNVAGGIQHHIRRAERSVLLFLASLVPGIGERQVEARNAAEAAQNAERARQEEEQQREQAAPEANHNENTNANNAQPAQEMPGAGDIA